MLDVTPFLRGYAALRYIELGSMDAEHVQERLLKRLIRRAQDTRFGQEHHFSEIDTVEKFQKCIPLRTYEDFYREYWQNQFPKLNNCTWPDLIPYFALTSGTTSGKSKYIPVSKDLIYSNWKAAQDILAHHIANNPMSNILGGKCLFLGGSTPFKEEAPGIFSGDMSGIEVRELPYWQDPWVFPHRDVALIPDWEKKINLIAETVLKEDIRSISGAPNWLLLFFDKLITLNPTYKRLVDFFPNLELIIHGAINFSPYYDSFKSLLAGSHAETRELYAASEGSIAVADKSSSEGLRLILDGGLFYEFVPLNELSSKNPSRYWIANVTTDVEYAIVLTTCSGLWSYILGDTIRFINLKPHRLFITGRTHYRLSVVGEHLIAEEIAQAVGVGAHAIGASVTDYCVGSSHTIGLKTEMRHQYLIEFSKKIPNEADLKKFGSCLDKTLRSLNDDYAQQREHDFGLKEPEIIAVKPGTFSCWMKMKGKLGGQHKVPRIINDNEEFLKLREFGEKMPL
ncbi:MAG: GH3 auxin-responsive promoter family protein [Hyphomicrobium sp.]